MSHFFTFSLSLISPPHSALIFLTFSYPFSWKIPETFRENISRIPTVVNDQDRSHQMWSRNNNFPAKGFSTPPPTWKSKASFSPDAPVSEKTRSMANKDDLFHVVHKVPAGDSPYVRAKQVQLIDKDPNRAISLFWAAINSGDRVDSALKDMAVVMKQLNRSDEAIEAIKSFRHLCPQESQESLDNVLVELYKRSGRLDEQIEMLQYKLKNIDEGSAFGGKRTKIARSQGKKIQISIEQEKSRLLGNLAWAYLQQGNYKTAGELYKQALALDPDRNKECNLAICLMYMNKIKEAKAMLYAIQVSSQNGRMDDSYVKSFERASQILTELEANSVIDPNEQEGHEEMRRHLRSLVSRNSIEVNSCINEENDHLSGLVASRRRAGRQQEETMLLDKPNRRSYCQNQFENKDNFSQPDEESSKCMSLGLSSAQSPQNLYTDKWKKGAQLENPFERSDFSSRRKGNWVSATDKVGSVQRRTYGSPLPVRGNSKFPSTEQRRGPCLLSKADQRKSTWGENTADSPGRMLSFEDPIAKEAGAMAPQNPDGRLQASSNAKLKIALQTSEKSLPSPGGSWGGITRVESEVVTEPISYSTLNGYWKWNSWGSDEYSQLKNEAVIESKSQPVANGNRERNYWGNVELKKFQMNDSNSSPSMQQKSPIARAATPITFNDGQPVADGDKQRNYWENVEQKKFPVKESNLSPSMQSRSPAAFSKAVAPASFNDGQPTADGDSKRYYWENDEKNNFAMKGSNSSPSMQLKSPTALDKAIAPATITDGECWEQSSDIHVMRDMRLRYSFDGKCFRENAGKLMSLQQVEGNPQLPIQDSSTSKNKMSWADMVEEEEQELLVGRTVFLESKLDYCYQKPSFSFQTPNKWYDGWSHGEDFNDENLNSNIFHQTPPSVHEIDNVSYKLEAFDLKDGYNTPGSDVSSRNNPTARRSLCFDQQQEPDPAEHRRPSPLPKKALNFEGYKFVPANETMSTSGSTIRPKRRNRLQVFRDITLHTESPRT